MSKFLHGSDAAQVYDLALKTRPGSNVPKPNCAREWIQEGKRQVCGKNTGYTQERHRGLEREWGFITWSAQLPAFVIEDQIFIPLNMCAGCAGAVDGWEGKRSSLPEYFPKWMHLNYEQNFDHSRKKRTEYEEKRRKEQIGEAALSAVKLGAWKAAVAAEVAKIEGGGSTPGSKFEG